MNSTEYVKSVIGKSPFRWVGGNYEGNNVKSLQVECKEGHRFIYSLHALQNFIRVLNKCTVCSKIRAKERRDKKFPVGSKIYHFTVLENDTNSSKSGMMKLQCRCGNEVYRRLRDVLPTSSCGLGDCRHNALNFTGMRLGILTVKSKLGILKNTSISYTCRCDCGNEVVRDTHYLQHTKKPSCGCIRFGHHMYNWKGTGEMPGLYFAQVKNGAKSRNLKISVSKEHIYELYLSQGKKCALSGLPISFGEELDRKAGGKRNITASLDRIDSSKGYEKGNVQWVHVDINQMKMDLSEDRFLELCGLVSMNTKVVG